MQLQNSLRERWKPVVGFEGQYEVSDHGHVRSLDRVVTYKRRDQYSGRTLTVGKKMVGRVLRPASSNNTEHLSVVLGRNNTRQVHTLVLEAFVGPCPPGHEGCHKNDVANDNWLTNLRWGTRSSNVQDALRNGRKPVGEKHTLAKLRNSDIPTIRELLKHQRPHTIAKRYSVSASTIYHIENGTSWRHV